MIEKQQVMKPVAVTPFKADVASPTPDTRCPITRSASKATTKVGTCATVTSSWCGKQKVTGTAPKAVTITATRSIAPAPRVAAVEKAKKEADHFKL